MDTYYWEIVERICGKTTIKNLVSRKIVLQMMISLDGFFEGANGDLSWHRVDEEFNEFAIDWLNSLDTLIFGRVVYELMYSYWPTSKAKIVGDDIVAERMNNLKKIVFSKTLKSADWNNSTLVKEFDPEEILKLKQQPGKDISVGGSDLAVSFIKHKLMDEIRIILVPLVLGSGKPLLEGVDDKLNLKLVKTRTFKSGCVLFCYEPMY
jgi:dihydrofolate reductase